MVYVADFHGCSSDIGYTGRWCNGVRPDMAVCIRTLARLLYLGVAIVAANIRDTHAVRLGQATVVGTIDGAVEKFLGIPFAQPP